MKLHHLILAVGCIAIPASAGAPIKGVITKPQDLLVGLPREVMLGLLPGSSSMLDACGKAAITVGSNAEGRLGSFKITVRGIDPFQLSDDPGTKRYRLHAVVELMRVAGVSIQQEIMAVPDVTENAKLAKLTPGSKVTVIGKISHAELLARTNAELHIDLMDAKLK